MKSGEDALAALEELGPKHFEAARQKRHSYANTPIIRCQRRFSKQNHCQRATFPVSLDNIGEVLAGTRKPPISEQKNDQREAREVCQSTPIRQSTFQQDPPVVAN